VSASGGLTLAQVIRAHGPAFVERWGGSLQPEQRRALRDLAECRTAALGGHVTACAGCGEVCIAYNSCRNRHCPTCQAMLRARWLAREAGCLLPVEYYHLVFTLPQSLAAWAAATPAVVYGLLFDSAAASVRELAADPHYLGAEVGLLAVLHTWGQNLHHHPHVHGVVTGGGLACDATGRILDRPRWVACRPGFFLPVRVLSRLFRGKFLAGLCQAHALGRLVPPAGRPDLIKPDTFASWLTPLYHQDWVVHAQPPLGRDPAQVLGYLARYVHRVAISNARLLGLEDGQVSFTWKDYSEDRREKTLTLDAEEFLRRFVQHVLPRGFVKVRHYGLLSNRRREQKLAVCRRLLLVERAATTLAAACVPEPPVCPACGGQSWVLIQRFDPGEQPSLALLLWLQPLPSINFADTS
jgi:hypothetical protein